MFYSFCGGTNFDIVGPYFTSEGTMSAKFIMACILKTVKIFQVCLMGIFLYLPKITDTWLEDQFINK